MTLVLALKKKHLLTQIILDILDSLISAKRIKLREKHVFQKVAFTRTCQRCGHKTEKSLGWVETQTRNGLGKTTNKRHTDARKTV